MFFHFYSHAVFQQIFFLGQQFGRQIPDALLGILAVGGAAKIHFGIDKPMTAAAALAGGVIFKKFYIVTALRAFYIKNCPFLPVLGILSGTFHG